MHRPHGKCLSLVSVCRGTTGGLLNKDPTTPAFTTEVTVMNEDSQSFNQTCAMEKLILSWMIFITAVVGLAGNAIVIWLLGFRMHRKAISVYILNLAGADFVYLCFNIFNFMQKNTSFFMFTQKYFVHFSFFGFFYSYITGLTLLSIISLERCMSVLCPIWYRSRRPRHTSTFMCMLAWALSLPLTILATYYCEILDFRISNLCKTFQFSIAAYLILLLVILLGSTLALMARLFCGSRKMPLSRLYTTILLTVLVFLFCGLPYGIQYFLIYWLPVSKHYLPCYQMVLSFLSSVNSCANPVIYFFVGSCKQWHRLTLKRILQRALQDTPEEDESGANLHQGTLQPSRS
ncbi:mas-related G-protein coupled receptor member X2-like [Thomomys bottae]